MKQTRLPYNLRPISRDCVHLVTRGHFRSRDKDVGHTIRSTVAQNPMLHANLMLYVLYNRWKFYIAWIRIFDLFCSCDLDLDPMTFTYELDPYSLEIYHMCQYELPTSRHSKVVVAHTYIDYIGYIDRQTDRHDRNYIPPLPGCFEGGQLAANVLVVRGTVVPTLQKVGNVNGCRPITGNDAYVMRWHRAGMVMAMVFPVHYRT